MNEYPAGGAGRIGRPARLFRIAWILLLVLGGAGASGDAPPCRQCMPPATLSFVTNGQRLNGGSFNAARGFRLGPSRLEISAEGSLLTGVDPSGKHIAGQELVGARFSGRLDDGKPVQMKVAAVSRHPDPAQDDTYLYDIRFLAKRRWDPICGTGDDGRPVLSILVAGTWNDREGVPGGGSWDGSPGRFTFACQGFVLAKCVESGYKPWKTAKVCGSDGSCKDVPLGPYHRACVRMMRADYCGNGRSYTLDGTPINLYDSIGIETDTEDWPIEAEWDETGARCLTHLRVPGQGTPPCAAKLAAHDCGDKKHFGTGTLLMDESFERFK